MKAPVVIVGAGIAGLTLAHRLVEQGAEVILVEKEGDVGGLARSFAYHGIVFDIGPHRFHTDDPEVDTYIRGVLGENNLTIDRNSKVWFYGRYHAWPLRLGTVFRLPPGIMARGALDIIRISSPQTKTFKDFVVSRYGRTLYEHFFRNYTIKFIGYEPSEIHSDWGRVGLDRAVIDKRYQVWSLTKILFSLFSASKAPMQFLYPKKGGIAAFCRTQRERIEAAGGKVLTGMTVTHIHREGNRAMELRLSNGQNLPLSHLVWSAPITELYRMCYEDSLDLEYLSSVVYNVIIDHPPLQDFQWCYFGTDDILFNRVSIPLHFSPYNAPEKGHGICVELSTKMGNYVWKNPQFKIDRIIQHLVSSRLVLDEREILDIFPEKVEHTYPIYKANYRAELKKGIDRLQGISNLHLLGRCGVFWYNNMDHSIKMALEMAGQGLDSPRRIEVRSIF